jgi:hypothetical protein
MEDFSIYRYMKLGIVHFKAFPAVSNGEAPLSKPFVKSWRMILTAGSLRMKDVKVRNEAASFLRPPT